MSLKSNHLSLHTHPWLLTQLQNLCPTLPHPPPERQSLKETRNLRFSCMHCTFFILLPVSPAFYRNILKRAFKEIVWTINQTKPPPQNTGNITGGKENFLIVKKVNQTFPKQHLGKSASGSRTLSQRPLIHLGFNWVSICKLFFKKSFAFPF